MNLERTFRRTETRRLANCGGGANTAQCVWLRSSKTRDARGWCGTVSPARRASRSPSVALNVWPLLSGKTKVRSPVKRAGFMAKGVRLWQHSMSKVLLSIQDNIEVRGRGVIVLPFVSPEILGTSKSGHTAQVRLVRPDGTQDIVEAIFTWERFVPGGAHYICRLPQGTKEQIPAGTAIWLLDGC